MDEAPCTYINEFCVIVSDSCDNNKMKWPGSRFVQFFYATFFLFWKVPHDSFITFIVIVIKSKKKKEQNKSEDFRNVLHASMKLKRYRYI